MNTTRAATATASGHAAWGHAHTAPPRRVTRRPLTAPDEAATV
ncbi:hypothetical protein AB0D49_33040 [Streptomyces sp. NPDC048290]